MNIGNRVVAVAGAIVVTSIGITGCGSSGGSGGSGAKSITCDEYSQKPYGPERIGGPGRTSDISDLLEAHGLDGFNTTLVGKVDKAITKYCGQTSLKGGVKAKRNNSSPIDNAVDWSTLSTKTK